MQGFCGAFMYTDTAASAFCGIYMETHIVGCDCTLWTPCDTMMALGASAPVPENLYARQLAFWVSTPAAAKRTSFKKDCSPDAWTIVDTEFLNIENDAGELAVMFHEGHSCSLRFFIRLRRRISSG